MGKCYLKGELGHQINVISQLQLITFVNGSDLGWILFCTVFKESPRFEFGIMCYL